MTLRGHYSLSDKLKSLPERSIRQENDVCKRRLLIYLDKLTKRRERITARLSRDIDRTLRDLDHVKSPRREFAMLKIDKNSTKGNTSLESHNEKPFYAPTFKPHNIDQKQMQGRSTPLVHPVPGHCRYGRECKSCRYFPCQRPLTYHSLGFRPDNCSTYEWITWEDLQMATRRRLIQGN